MQFTVQKMIDTTLVVAQIIREGRPMPQKGKYRLARLHAKLYPEYEVATKRRDEMIKAYETHQQVPATPPAEGMVDGPEWIVPDDKLEDFNAAWKVISEEVIDIDVQPIPLAYLDRGDTVDGAISAAEITILGDLVTE